MVLSIIATTAFLFFSTLVIGYLPIRCLARQDIDGQNSKYMQMMSKISIGMLFGTTFALVIPEAIENTPIDARILGVTLMLGFLLVLSLDTLVHGLSHQKMSQFEQIYTTGNKDVLNIGDLLNFKSLIRLFATNDVLFALFIHGLADGVTLAVTEINESLKTVMFLAIFIHRIPATISLSSIMITRQRLHESESIINIVIFSLSSPIGYILFLCFDSVGNDLLKNWSSIFLMLSAGSLLYATIPALLGFDVDSNVLSDMGGYPSQYQEVHSNNASSYDTDIQNGKINTNLNYSTPIYIVIGILVPIIISFSINE